MGRFHQSKLLITNIFSWLSAFVISLFLSQTATANVLGNMQTLAPTPDSLYFQNVHSSMTLAQGRWNVGFFLGYAKDQLTVYDDLVTPDFVNYKDYGITSDFILAYGLTQHFELMYSAPGFVDQKPDSNQTTQHTISSGINTHRPGFKYNFSQDKNGGFAAAVSADFPMSQEDPYVGTSPKPIYNLELVYDYRRATDAFAINFGYRKRTPGGIPAGNSYFYPLKDQFIYSLAYVMGVGSPQRYHFEVYGSMAQDKTPHLESKHVSSLEALIGFKQRIFDRFWWHIGGTAELMAQGLAPAYRVYTGLNFYFGGNNKERVAKRPQDSPLRISPEYADLKPGDVESFQVSGGKPPYQFKLEPPFGDFDSFDQTYRAPSESGSTTLIVEDSMGKTAEAKITVGTPTGISGNPLVITPGSVTMIEGSQQKFKVSGGQPPYKFRLIEPLGRFNAEKLAYLAPTSPGETQLLVEDSVGQSQTVNITVTALPKPQKDLIIRNLVFVFDTARLTPESQTLLEQNLSALREMSIHRLIVAGHTDNLGSDDYNQELSRERAQTVADILIQRLALEPSQVEAVGYGESRPIAANDTDQGRQTNRRVELKIYHRPDQQ